MGFQNFTHVREYTLYIKADKDSGMVRADAGMVQDGSRTVKDDSAVVGVEIRTARNCFETVFDHH